MWVSNNQHYFIFRQLHWHHQQTVCVLETQWCSLNVSLIPDSWLEEAMIVIILFYTIHSCWCRHNLTRVTGMVLVSTATLYTMYNSVTLYVAVITCLYDVSIQPDDQSVNSTVHIHNSNLAIIITSCNSIAIWYQSVFKVHLPQQCKTDASLFSMSSLSSPLSPSVG